MTEITPILVVTIPALVASITTLYLAISQRKDPAHIEDKVKGLLVPSQAALFDLSEEVFRARQDHTVLSSKIDTVQVQMTEIRADIASLSETVQGTKVPSSRTTKGVK
jgi:hypothetical protein